MQKKYWNDGICVRYMKYEGSVKSSINPMFESCRCPTLGIFYGPEEVAGCLVAALNDDKCV